MGGLPQSGEQYGMVDLLLRLPTSINVINSFIKCSLVLGRRIEVLKSQGKGLKILPELHSSIFLMIFLDKISEDHEPSMVFCWSILTLDKIILYSFTYYC